MGFIASVLLFAETFLAAGAFAVVFDGAGFPSSDDFNVFRSLGRSARECLRCRYGSAIGVSIGDHRWRRIASSERVRFRTCFNAEAWAVTFPLALNSARSIALRVLAAKYRPSHAWAS
jgi:hypothetical protein